MVVIDSSESSSDEEDRRLRPIRRRDSAECGTRTRIFDVSEKPEGSASTDLCLHLRNGHNISSFQTSYQTQGSAVHAAIDSVSGCSFTGQQIAQDITDEIISHTKLLEDFVRKIELIPSHSLATKKFHIGLQLINECIQSIHNVAIPDDHINTSNVFQYSTSVHNADNYMEGWCNVLDYADYFPVQPDTNVKNVVQKHNARNVQDASSQTTISGDVIPREASAALEFFQELIKNS